MTIQMDYLDKLPLLKIIGRKLRNKAEEKGIILQEWCNLYAKSHGENITQGDLSNILNGKKGISSEKLNKIAKAIGINGNELEKIVAESKKDELRIYYGVDVSNKTNEELKILEDFDTETLELLKDLDFDADFLKNIKLSVKGKNKDRLKEDLRVIFEHYKRLGEIEE